MMSEYRLFIAIELPAAASKALARVQAGLKSAPAVRWSNPTNIHLTLQFLGNVAVTKVEPLVSALQTTIPPLRPFDLSLAGVGAFPNPKRPRVIWAGISARNDMLPVAHRAVIEATQSAGFTPESRPFKAHLTIGRVQKWAKPADYAQIERVLTRQQVGSIAAFPVKRISLIRSELKPAGPVYTTLAEIALAGKRRP